MDRIAKGFSHDETVAIATWWAGRNEGVALASSPLPLREGVGGRGLEPRRKLLQADHRRSLRSPSSPAPRRRSVSSSSAPALVAPPPPASFDAQIHWIDVVLLEPNASFTACPFSNEVVAGLRDIAAQRFDYRGVAETGVRVVQAAATAIDPSRRSVTFGDNNLPFRSADPSRRASTSPGMHCPASRARVSECRTPGRPGGVLLLASPARGNAGWRLGGDLRTAHPYRCPPGPYERASLIAWYLKANKPRSKLILLDAKDTFSKQKLFQSAWKQLYYDLLQWVSLSDGGKVTRVDPATNTFETDFGSHKADVANVIPPQRAGSHRQRQPTSPIAPAGAGSGFRHLGVETAAGDPRDR